MPAHRDSSTSLESMRSGRALLFGPVFAAAVTSSPDCSIRGLRDSKLLDAERRDAGPAHSRTRHRLVVAAVDAFEIDRINILQGFAPGDAARRPAARPSPDYLLVDAVTVDLPIAQRALIHGDALSQCIAAASICEVQRDACMRRGPGLSAIRLEIIGPSTDEHWKALGKHGPAPPASLQLLRRVREHAPHAAGPDNPRQAGLLRTLGAAEAGLRKSHALHRAGSCRALQSPLKLRRLLRYPTTSWASPSSSTVASSGSFC